MNCSQARVLLAAHRELNDRTIDMIALDIHLEHCARCREELARAHMIGEELAFLPPVAPDPAFQARVFQAIAAEHRRFMQRSPAVTPPPEFLKPYLQELASSAYKTDALTAFSSADTGPLPVVRQLPRKSGWFLGRPAMVLALAAIFLMTLMMGGITSLLLLAQNHMHNGLNTGSTSIDLPTNVVQAVYQTNTPYQHVVSAVADQNDIYYTAYGNGAYGGWMLEKLDRQTKQSTPMLAVVSPGPLVILGSQNDGLVWMEYQVVQTHTPGPSPSSSIQAPLRKWSVQYLPLHAAQTGKPASANKPVTLLADTFDQQAAPDWVQSPVQGIWFLQGSLLIASVDIHGISHLQRFEPGMASQPLQIATAPAGHILTSPTANSDGSQLFWADEWRSADTLLHSDVWTLRISEEPRLSYGRLPVQTILIKQLYIGDGQTFQPRVADNVLFVLAQTNGPLQINGNQDNGSAAATPTLAPNSNATSSSASISWADSSVFPTQLDTIVSGTLYMLPLDDATPSPVKLSAPEEASSLQAGHDFVLWHKNDGTYGMYDAASRTYVVVGDVLNNAQFLAVNGEAATWTENTADTTNNLRQQATLYAFDWPIK